MSEEVLEQEIEHEKGLRAARQKISDKLSGKIKGGEHQLPGADEAY